MAHTHQDQKTIVMPEPKNPEGLQENNKPELEQVVEENTNLKKKHEDLNRGIAKYRDDSQKVNDENQTLKQRVKELETASKLDDDFEQKFSAHADKMGFVKKGDLQKKEQEQAVENQKTIANNAYNEFVTAHPEYRSDEDWAKVTQEFNDSMYKTPTTLEGHRKIYNKIHNTLSAQDEKEKGKQEAKAEAKTNSRLTLGGGSQGASGGDATIENLKKKYPALTEAQIKQRLAEIDALYPEKK